MDVDTKPDTVMASPLLISFDFSGGGSATCQSCMPHRRIGMSKDIDNNDRDRLTIMGVKALKMIDAVDDISLKILNANDEEALKIAEACNDASATI